MFRLCQKVAAQYCCENNEYVILLLLIFFFFFFKMNEFVTEKVMIIHVTLIKMIQMMIYLMITTIPFLKTLKHFCGWMDHLLNILRN
jgi:TM2 domain-containing membrane protein YozV